MRSQDNANVQEQENKSERQKDALVPRVRMRIEHEPHVP